MPTEGLAHPITRTRGPGLITQHVDHPAGATPLRHRAGYRSSTTVHLHRCAGRSDRCS